MSKAAVVFDKLHVSPVLSCMYTHVVAMADVDVSVDADHDDGEHGDEARDVTDEPDRLAQPQVLVEEALPVDHTCQRFYKLRPRSIIPRKPFFSVCEPFHQRATDT